MHDKLAERLKQQRKKMGETQAQMGDLIDVTISTVSQYERGIIKPPVSKLKALAKHYGVSVDYLTGVSDVPTPNDQEVSTQTNVSQQLQELLDALHRPDSDVVFYGRQVDDHLRKYLTDSIKTIMFAAELIQQRNCAI